MTLWRVCCIGVTCGTCIICWVLGSGLGVQPNIRYGPTSIYKEFINVLFSHL